MRVSLTPRSFYLDPPIQAHRVLEAGMLPLLVWQKSGALTPLKRVQSPDLRVLRSPSTPDQTRLAALGFFQYEAWLHAEVPRVNCDACGKRIQVGVPWARPEAASLVSDNYLGRSAKIVDANHFTLLFETLAMSLCQVLPVAPTAKRLQRRIEHYVDVAGANDTMAGVKVIGIDEAGIRSGQNQVTLMHDLEAKRLLFLTEGSDHKTVTAFKDLIALAAPARNTLTGPKIET